MKTSQSSRLLAILLAMIVAAGSSAQEAEEEVAPPAPDFSSLQSNWWPYFEGPGEVVEPRATEFLNSVELQIADLAAQNQEIAASLLEAVRANMTAYLTLLDDTELTSQELPPPAVNYSLDDLLDLASSARDAQAEAAEEQLEVEREQRVLDGATRRRDAAFRDYLDAAAGDEQWLAALRLIQSRLAQEISSRRLELLSLRFERATEYAESAEVLVELAVDLLEPTTNSTDLNERISADESAVATAVVELRAARLAASGLDVDTVQGRSQRRLQQQRLLEAEVRHATAEVALASSEAKYWWTLLDLDSVPAISELEDRVQGWDDLLRNLEQQASEWQRDTEDELLAVQSINRDGLDRASSRLLDQRLGTAQETLAELGFLESSVADLELLMQVVDGASAEYSGAIRSWITSINRFASSAYDRVAELADLTLFSVGETPVTGGDILRVIIILAVAVALSRGIRHAIRRVGESQGSGTQASMYTVGRLTHYAVIIVALFIALSSIGLDFGNLALVAGALSVGIGFGLQSIVNNFVSGLIILFEHTLRVGDYIELDTGLTGTVKAINVRSTLINTNDNIDIVVPNSEFVSTRLTNWTLGERILRVRIPFGVAYGSDKDLVKQAAIEAAAEVPYTLTHMSGREPDAWLVEFGDNSLNFLLLAWVNRQGARRPTRTRAAYLWALETKLGEYGIEIPFPQRDLHLRSGWPPPEKKLDDVTDDSDTNDVAQSPVTDK